MLSMFKLDADLVYESIDLEFPELLNTILKAIEIVNELGEKEE